MLPPFRHHALPKVQDRPSFWDWWVPVITKGVASVEPRWEDGIFLGVSDRSDELYVGCRARLVTEIDKMEEGEYS